jgi:polygalacturonase
MLLLVGAVMLAVLGLSGAALAEASPCPLPDEIARSTACEVTADGQAVPVMDTAVNLSRTWTSRPVTTTAPVARIRTDGETAICVRFVGAAIQSAVVRPLSLGIVPASEGATVAFTLPGPAQVTVEINGEQAGALHLFASAPEAAPPAGGGVTVYGDGLHDVGTVTLTDGQTVYLSAGAVVRGQFVAEGADHISIRGPGVIDGSTFDRWENPTGPIDLSNCTHVTLAGMTILDPAAGTVNLYRCEDVTVTGVNIIGARSNSDGISVQSCRRVAVSGCFVRGWDDNLVVKGYDADASDISFTDCVLWTDLAQSCESATKRARAS